MGRRLIGLVAVGIVAFACGDDDDTPPTGGGEAGASAQAGEPAEAGAGNAAGSPHHAGAPAGNVGGAAGGVGGAAGGAGGVAGAACECVDPDCDPDYDEVPDAEGCCTYCRIKPEVCEQQRTDYLETRAQLHAKYTADTCQDSSDCHRYLNPPACGVIDCDLVITGPQLGEFQAALEAYAEESCNPDCPLKTVGDPPGVYLGAGGEAGAGAFECEPTVLGCLSSSHRCRTD